MGRQEVIGVLAYSQQDVECTTEDQYSTATFLASGRREAVLHV